MATRQLLGLRVELTFHWGFWVRAPFTSRYQETLTIPPPTTLIGALAEPLIHFGLLNGVKGEVVKTDLGVSSAAAILDSAIPAVSFYFNEKQAGFTYEDTNKYITLHYHQLVPEKDEKTGTLLGKRRYLPQYRMGALRVGKVSMPNGGGTACYIIDLNEARKLLVDNPEECFLKAASNITRVGSKESIVSVSRAEILPNLNVLKPPLEVRTKCYFPYKLAEASSEPREFYIEKFWRGGWSRKDKLIFEDYIIPGTRVPISTKPTNFKIVDGYVIMLRDEEVICF
ncbi:MAG: CRISPR-associated protein Cas5 [Nitrososphaerales archaeon]